MRKIYGLPLLVVALLVPAVAVAHAHLKRAVPAAGARLAEAPRELRLTFSESPSLAFTRVVLLASSGDTIALAPAAVAPDDRGTVVAAVRGAIVTGSYTVAWQVAGDDGHVTRGRYTFTVAPAVGTRDSVRRETPRAPEPRVPRPASRPEFGAESPLYAAVRWLQFVALLTVLGAVAFARVLARLARTSDAHVLAPMTTDARGRAARVGLAAAIALGVVALLRLVAQSHTMHDTFDAGLVGAMLAHTVWGAGWLLQAAAVVVAAIGFAAARTRAGGWTLAAFGALALAVTPALSGHAASAPGFRALAVVADALHVIGSGTWLGGLLLVVAVGVPSVMRDASTASADRRARLAALVRAFSSTALASAALVVATGLVAAWLHVGAVSALWCSAYGLMLLRKLVVFAGVVAMGAYNWRVVQPALGTGDAAVGAARVRRTGATELALALVVLALTAVLVATPTPLDVAP